VAQSSSSSSRPLPKLLRATYLADQEALLRETRGTALFYFPGPVLWLLIFAVVDYSVLAARAGWSGVPGLAWLWGLDSLKGHLDTVLLVVVAISLLLLLWLLVRYLRWISTVYAVTTTRVIVQSGIFGRDFDEIPIPQVRGVDVHQSFGQRILGYGTVRVSSEGGSKLGNEDWMGIPKPFEFQRLIEGANQVISRGPR
jgi:membrane protein YdbS with pleckstrin-like domain